MGVSELKRVPGDAQRPRGLRRKNVALFWLLIGLCGLFFVLTLVRFEEQHQRKSPETGHTSGGATASGIDPSGVSEQRLKEEVHPLLRVVMAALALPADPYAEQFRVGPVVIDQMWARSTPPVAKTGAVYLTIHNTGSEPDRLVGAVSAAADKVELHTSTTEGGIVSMRQVDAVTLAPASTARLAPSGTHMMLVCLRAPLTAGENFPLTLVFEKAGGVEIHVKILGRAPTNHGTGH